MPDYGGRPIVLLPTGWFWVVQPGETIHDISQHTGIAPQQLMAYNPYLHPSYPCPGAYVWLPYSRSVTASDDCQCCG